PFHLFMKGNNGADTLTGTAFNDTIQTGTGNNVVIGGGGADSLDGSLSNANVFIISSGAHHTSSETIKGGNGLDGMRLTSAVAGDTLTLSANITDPNNTMTVSVSTDPASVAGVGSNAGGVALAVDAHLGPTNLSYTIRGNDGGDQLVGGLQGDTILGGAGND